MAWNGLGITTFANSAEEAVADADVVILATSSGEPVVDESAIKDDALVTSISTNVARAHEIAPKFLTRAQVYCDYQDTTPAAAGDMVLAMQNHGWSPASVVGDLGGLVTGACPKPTAGSPMYFRSIGLGLEDIAIANAIYRATNTSK